MNKFDIAVCTAALALACSTGAIAQSMSKADYKSGRDRIAAEYKSDQAGCGSLSANAKDVCVIEAKGKEKIAKAELESARKPSAKTRYAVDIARAETDYAVAKEKCDDKSGDAKKICVMTAKDAQNNANADAKGALNTTQAVSKPAQTSIAPMTTKVGTKQYVENSVTATNVKTAYVEEAAPKLAQISVETDPGLGKAVYEKSCKGCHSAMKPKFGDKEAWAPLIKQGPDVLTATVIKGKGMMPARGMAATDADVKAAVAYIVSQSK